MRIGEELDGLRLEFSNSFVGEVGDGRNINFWMDRWVARKEDSVIEKGSWVNGIWCWDWDWVRPIRGRVSKDFEDLTEVLQSTVVSNDCRDTWRWVLGEDGDFKVKELSILIEEKIIQVQNGGHEMLWNKLLPKKNVNIPVGIFSLWQAVIWTTGYFIWKERNDPLELCSSAPGLQVMCLCISTCKFAFSAYKSPKLCFCGSVRKSIRDLLLLWLRQHYQILHEVFCAAVLLARAPYAALLEIVCGSSAAIPGIMSWARRHYMFSLSSL
ncbi:hypothetical protein Tco_0625195 [Tanacetum coccineum]|uniref:Reverse transcriptase zinc-binding domain-containing protein n=1 Tax=Tanacetum coccineum TaxID=301880 RepID=A0ABQ4WG55_9ASTR